MCHSIWCYLKSADTFAAFFPGTEVMLWGALPSCTDDNEIRDTDLEIECFR